MEQKEKKPEDYQIKSVWLKCFFDFKLAKRGEYRMMAKFQNFCSSESFFRDSCAVYLWPNHWHSLSFSSQTSLLFKAVSASDCSFAKWKSEIFISSFHLFLRNKDLKMFSVVHGSHSFKFFGEHFFWPSFAWGDNFFLCAKWAWHFIARFWSVLEIFFAERLNFDPKRIQAKTLTKCF